MCIRDSTEDPVSPQCTVCQALPQAPESDSLWHRLKQLPGANWPRKLKPGCLVEGVNYLDVFFHGAGCACGSAPNCQSRTTCLPGTQGIGLNWKPFITVRFSPGQQESSGVISVQRNACSTLCHPQEFCLDYYYNRLPLYSAILWSTQTHCALHLSEKKIEGNMFKKVIHISKLTWYIHQKFEFF